MRAFFAERSLTMENNPEKNSKKRKLFDDSALSEDVNEFKVNKKYAKSYYEKNAQSDFIACMTFLSD